LDLDKCPKSTKIAALFEETLSDLDKCPKVNKIAFISSISRPLFSPV